MRRLTLTLMLVLAPAALSAQQRPTPDEMRAMIEKLGPGPEHRTLAALEGRWSVDISYNMGGGPTRTKGTAVNRMILGGRFLHSEATSPMPAGYPEMGDARVESLTIYGFDRRTSEYTILGLDTMGTYWVSAAGVMRPEKTIVMSGQSLDDATGTREMRQYDMVLRIVDADTYVTQIIFKFPNRPDLKIVEITHRRMK
jgi:hypothetical protein